MDDQLGTHRAEIYDRNGNAGKAIQAYTLAARNPENRAASLLFRARLLQKIGDLEQALGDANEAVAALPDEAAYSVRGHIYRDRGELDKCIDDYGRAIQLCPNPVFFEIVPKCTRCSASLTRPKKIDRLLKLRAVRSPNLNRAVAAILTRQGATLFVALIPRIVRIPRRSYR
jgi:tetratricopeptide (TPR) repeat protein